MILLLRVGRKHGFRTVLSRVDERIILMPLNFMSESRVSFVTRAMELQTSPRQGRPQIGRGRPCVRGFASSFRVTRKISFYILDFLEERDCKGTRGNSNQIARSFLTSWGFSRDAIMS